MKLDKLKKLFRAKRVIALALAAAMTVTSLPQTAYAAEAETVEMETAETQTAEAETAEEADAQQENEQTVESTAPAEVIEAETKEQETVEAETANEPKTQAAEAKTAGESDAQEAENQAEGDSAPAYTLENKLESDAEIMTAAYDGYVKFADNNGTPSGEILGQIRIKGSDGTEERLDNVTNAFTYKWRKDGAKDEDPDENPINAGDYKLVITPDADGKYANAEPLTITGFTINKADVTVTMSPLEVKPGTAPEKVIDSITSLTVSADNGSGSFTYDSERKENQLKVTVEEVINPLTGSKTTDTYLKANGDYTAKITVSFSDAKDADGNELVSAEEKGNYNLPKTITERIDVADLKETRTTLEVTGASPATRSDNDAEVQVITKTYDGSAAAVPTYNAKVEEIKSGVDEDGNEIDQSVAVGSAVTEGAWHSAEFRSWTESAAQKNKDGTEKTDENGDVVYDTKTLCSLTVGGELGEGKNPTEAGAYVYRVSYKGDKEQYAGSYADIVVEIAPVEVEVAPQAMEGASFYAGETVKSVLSKITWKLDKTVNAENIWGTSYDYDRRTQPYEPVFAVYRVKDKVAETAPMSNEAKLTKAEGVEYQVRFIGKKAVRSADGANTITKDINDAAVDSFNSNYKTSTDETKNPLTLTLSEKDVKIDVTPLTSDAALKDAGLKKSDTPIDGNAVYTRVYDENHALFESRADYKKATASDNGELTYKWYMWRKSRDLNQTYVEVFNKDWDFESTGNWIPLPINSEDFIDNIDGSLKSAGIYKLEITYDDGTAYAQENVYYAIERQQLRYVPTNALPAARYGAAAKTYIASVTNDENFSPKLQIRPNNTDNWTDLTGWIEGIDYSIYDDPWSVEAKAPIPAEKDKEPDWEGWTEVDFFDLRTGEEGQTVEQNEYRLGGYVDIIINNILHDAYNYTFYEYLPEPVKTAEGEPEKKKAVLNNLSVKDITVEKAGDKVLTLPLEKAIEAEQEYNGKAISVDLSGVKYMDGDKAITPKFIWEYDNWDDDEVLPEEAVKGGTYNIYAYYDGDADYAPMGRSHVATATITPKELTVSVKQPLAEEVIAKAVGGNYAGSIYEDYTYRRADGDMLTVSGCIADDEAAFTKWVQIKRDEDGNFEYGYPAWAQVYIDDDIEYIQPGLRIGSGKENDYKGRLKGGETYTLNVDADDLGELSTPYCYNYTLKAGAPVEITAAYASSEVTLYPGSNTYSYNPVTITDNKTKGETEQFVHDITFRESIPYTAAQVKEDGIDKTVYGNYATVVIRIPAEFDSLSEEKMAFYKNALKTAGAIAVYDRYNSNSIEATFNLSKDAENGLEPNPVTFSIAWKEGFVEKFTITPTENNLAADLRKAVAPKSVAFNAPKTKMVVGEVQDLDVKITKVQNEDLVYLDYRIADGEGVLAIGSQGRITALKEGTATVEVYPVKIANNSKVQITTVKPAQVKIAVSKVAAPKAGTVAPADVSVKVQYPYVKNNGKYYDYGYRREVYIMPENKKTAAEFDAAIAKFEQTGDYKAAGLAAAPIYITNDVEEEIANMLARGVYTELEYNDRIAGFAKGKNVTLQVEVGGLTPKTPYTVYVRNVSAQRTVLDKDGSKKVVELSSNGTLKDFKTTLGQVKRLRVKAEGDEKYAVLRRYDADEDGAVRGLVRYYEYDLASAAGAQLTVEGVFSAIEAEDTEKAEDFDLSQYYYPLPFTDAALKTKLLEPKLEYRMYQVKPAADGSWEYVTHDYYDENEGDWYDKDGYYGFGNNACLTIAKYTNADKKGALKFAQPEVVAVTAYDTVTKTESAPIIVRVKAEADSAAGKKITLQVGQTTPIEELVTYKFGKYTFDSANPYFTHEAAATGNTYLEVDVKNGTITPVIFDKTNAKQSVPVTGTPTVTGAAEITIKDLDPVKNLKFNNLIDNSFVLDFVPSIYAEGYIVDIRNASGGLVQRKYIPQYDKDNPYNDGFIWYYNTKKKAYTLIENRGYEDWFKVDNLHAQCKYNVTVTAVYGSAESKKVSKAVTTTKIPAADSGISADAMNDGMGIRVFAKDDFAGYAQSYSFVSGNRYTLVADANAGAQYAVTDKLTWSSSDGKVAKISAVGGTYSASLKALKAGTTIIEVKSGILKQTIARWKITVRAVGDAYNNAYFYDENEDLRGDGTEPYEIEANLVLNVPMAVELAARGRKTYKFVAEEAGNYKVVLSGGMGADVYTSGLTDMSKGGIGYVTVEADSEPASGTITVEKVSGTDPADRIPLKLNESVTIPANGWAVFTADGDADKLYNFSGSGLMSLYKSPGSDLVKSGSSSIDYAMKKKTNIYVKNNSGDNTVKVTAVNMPALKTGETYTVNESNTYSWYTFTASEKSDYRFKRSDNSNGDFDLRVYKNFEEINSDNNNYGNSPKQTVSMNAGDTVYVKVRSRYADGAEASFTVTKVDPVAITKDKEKYTVEAQDTTSYSITPETDAVYAFTLDSSVTEFGLYLDDGKDTVIKSDTWINSIVYPLKAETAYSLKVNNNNGSEKTLTVANTVIGALDVTRGGGIANLPKQVQTRTMVILHSLYQQTEMVLINLN